MKPTKQEYINWIAERLLKIPVDRKSMITEFCGYFQVTERTFDNYWKIATEQHRERLQAKQKAIDDAMGQEAQESVKRNIMTKLEAMEILSNIGRGIPTGEKEPTPAEQRGSLELLAKFQGWLDDKSDDKPITININTDNVNLDSDDI